MKSLRHFGFALWLAFALVAGQQLALLHELGHATELVQKHDSKPAPTKCDQHYATSQLVGSPPAGLVVALDCGSALARAVEGPGAHAAHFNAYRSRAPPTLL